MSSGVIFTDDYTRLVNFRSRQWTVGDVSMAWCGGLAFDIALSAGRTALPVLAGVFVVLLCMGGSWPLLVTLLAPVVFGIAYYLQAHRDPDQAPLRTANRGQLALRGLGTGQRRALRRGFHRQPRSLLDLGHNHEPELIDWQVVLYSPDGDDQARAIRQ